MLNNVCLMGRLTSDPVIYQGKEKNLARFSLAVNVNETEAHFFDCKVFGQDATMNYLAKGDQIAISGRLAQETFTRKDGGTGHAVVIIVNNIEFADVLGHNTEDEEKAIPSEEVAREEAKPQKPVAGNRRTR